MDREDYQNLFLEAAKLDSSEPFKIEFEIDTEPGEDSVESFMRFLVEQEIMIPNGTEYDFNLTRAEQVNPILRKILEAMLQAEAYYQVDQMVKDDLVFLTADEDGNMIFEYTEAGKRWLEEDQE